MTGTVDAVYILGNGSKYGDEEMRYSVRSLCLHVKNLRRLTVVGCWPMWLNRSNKFIPWSSPYRCKDANIAGGIALACRDEDVTDPFLCVHDDHFMLKTVDAATFPAWHKLPQAHWKSSDKEYDSYLKGCLTLLAQAGVTKPLNFETHTPILIHKDCFLNAIRPLDMAVAQFTVKSLYANQCDKLIREQVDDYKIKPPGIDWARLQNRPCFSVSPTIPDNVWGVLRRLYRRRSRFERNV